MISIIFFKILSSLTCQNSSREHYLPEEAEIFTQGVNIIYNYPGVAAVHHYEKLYNINADEFDLYFLKYIQALNAITNEIYIEQ